MTGRDPLRHHHGHRDGRLFGNRPAERLAGRVAEGIGTVQFLIIALGLIIVWIVVNGGFAYFSGAIKALGHGKPFDPAPWILLNLIFSFEAFFTGSLVVIAAKSQALRSIAREEADAKHREELAGEQRALLQANTDLTAKVHELAAKIDSAVSGAGK